jgi:hypothetical protein
VFCLPLPEACPHRFQVTDTDLGLELHHGGRSLWKV